MRNVALPLIALLTASAAQAQDWTGPYAGLGVSRADGDQSTATLSFPLEGRPISIFAGYNLQSGSMVYGGELAIHNDDASLTGFPAISYNRLTDLKGRIGYATGRTLVYGVLAFSQVEYQNGPNFFDDLDGLTYGIGADVMVSDKVFAGAEYMHRELDHTTDPDVTSDYSTVTLRIGMRF
jgi:opacity protein-like surface antigen